MIDCMEDCMDNNYIYTLQTVKDYPIVMQRRLIGSLLNENVLTKKEGEKGKIFLGDEKDAFLNCLRKNKKLIKSIEKWEFEKSYKYSLLFTFEENVSDKIKQALKKERLKNYLDISDNQYEELYNIVKSPSYLYYNENLEFIKFNIKMEARDADSIEHKKRYPILVCVFHDMNIIEIRFDSLGTIFGKDKMQYVYDVVNWIKLNLTDTILSMDLEATIEEMRHIASKEEELIIVEQDMRLHTGATATIGIGKSGSKSLPFIGELKEILEDFEDELKKIPDLKRKLEDFIIEKEELSEYPWTIFRFDKENYETKIIKNYRNEGNWLIQHFYSGRVRNIGKERMENVTRYINTIRKHLETDETKCDPTGEIA